MNSPALHPPACTAQAVHAASARRGILLVDEHGPVRRGLRALVRAQAVSPNAWRMFEATTLANALATYGTHDGEIAVVVLGLALPDAQGLDGLVAFRNAYPHAPITVLSDAASLASAHRALELGALAYFPKTGDLDAMLAFVHACVLHGPQVAREHRRRLAPVAPWNAALSKSATQLTSRQLQAL